MSHRPYRSIRHEFFRCRSGRPDHSTAGSEPHATAAHDGSGTFTENTNRPPGRSTRSTSASRRS